MNLFKKLSGRAEKPRTDPTTRVELDSVVVASDLGDFIPRLDPRRIGKVIGMALRGNHSGDMRGLLVREIAGNLKGDIYDRFGTATECGVLNCNEKWEFVFVLKYPPSIWDKVSATELTKFVSERADYWFYYFVQKMSETAERLGDD